MQKRNWAKKSTILISAVAVVLVLLAGLTEQSNPYCLQVDWLPIQKEMYSYYVAQALSDSALRPKAGQKPTAAQQKEIRTQTEIYITQMVAVSSELHNMGVSIDQVYKKQVAQYTGQAWRVYGGYYKKIGVSKEMVALAQTGRVAKEQLFTALYAENGRRAVPEAEVKAYFYGNYAACNGVRVFLRERAQDMDDATWKKEKDALKIRLQTFADEVNREGKNFFSAAMENVQLLGNVPENIVYSKDNAFVTAEMIEQLRGLDSQKITLLEFPDFFLLAQGFNMRENEGEYYRNYKSEVLHKLKDAEYAALLEDMTATYQTGENPAAIKTLFADWRFT
jgi:hypothetical protein